MSTFRAQQPPSRACMRWGLALALLVAACAPRGAAAVKGISDWNSGLITHFGGAQDGMNPSNPSFGTKDGACGYGLIPKEQYPYFSTAALSPSNSFYKADAMGGCGQCFQIQCDDSRGGVCKKDDAGKPLSVMVMISDKCPECEADHIDVQSLTFAKLADPGIGRIDVNYRRVECTPPDDMQVSIMDFGGAGQWLRLTIDDAGGQAAVKSVAVKGGDSDWKQLDNSWGATWEVGNAPAPPLSFQIVGQDGQILTASGVVKQNGGIANGAFGKRATFDSNVQFTISDPAYGQVTAFDGPSDPMLITSSTPGADGGGSSGSGSSSANSSGSGNSAASPAPTSSRGGASPSPSSVGGSCQDQPTPDGHSCAQQKGWGKCEQDFIKTNGFCKKTCGHCDSGGAKVQAYAGPSNGSGRKLLLRRR